MSEFNSVDAEYNKLVSYVLKYGDTKPNTRGGVDTISVFGYNYKINAKDPFPIISSKKVNWKNIIIENLWFLSGHRDIKFLHKHNCHFWDDWADPNKRVPSSYGYYWKDFHGNDQIRYVLNELNQNPNSRKMIVSAWYPEDAQNSTLPPCHVMWGLNVQNTYNSHGSLFDRSLNLHLTQRSGDCGLGVPYNIAGYSFLLHLFSHLSQIPVGQFSHSIIDAHIYTAKDDDSMIEYDHITGLQEQIGRPVRKNSKPQLSIDPRLKSFDDVIDIIHNCSTDEILEIFKLTGYDPHPNIYFKPAV